MLSRPWPAVFCKQSAAMFSFCLPYYALSYSIYIHTVYIPAIRPNTLSLNLV